MYWLTMLENCHSYYETEMLWRSISQELSDRQWGVYRKLFTAWKIYYFESALSHSEVGNDIVLRANTPLSGLRDAYNAIRQEVVSNDTSPVPIGR